MALIFAIAGPILSVVGLTILWLANCNLRATVKQQRAAMDKLTAALEEARAASDAQERLAQSYRDHIDLMNLLNPVSIKKGDLN